MEDCRKACHIGTILVIAVLVVSHMAGLDSCRHLTDEGGKFGIVLEHFLLQLIQIVYEIILRAVVDIVLDTFA